MSRRVVLITAFLAACAAAPHSLENVPLVWMPERHPRASAGAASDEFLKTKFRVPPMKDLRENQQLIGENQEKAPSRPVTTSDNVATFVTDQFKALLTGAGLQIVDSGENVTINGEIRQFFVTETEDYVGKVTLHITATSPSGKTLWEGVTSGESTRVGRSYSATNYYQSLSDALTIATNHLLQDSAFQAAVTGKR